jgi:hypothetical protein
MLYYYPVVVMIIFSRIYVITQNYAEQYVIPNRLSQQDAFESVGENHAAGSGAADYNYVGFGMMN